MEWVIYFLDTASKFVDVLIMTMLVSGVGFAISVWALYVGLSSCENYDDAKRFAKMSRISGFVLLISTISYVTIPNSKTLAAMYLVPAIAKNEQLQNITGNSLKVLEKLTQKWAQDLMRDADTAATGRGTVGL